MRNNNLIDHLFEVNKYNYNTLDLCQYELQRIIYGYGNHFKNNLELFNPKRHRVKHFIRIAYFLYQYCYLGELSKDTTHIVSNAYYDFNSELNNLGYSVYRPVWSMKKWEPVLANLKLLMEADSISRTFQNANFGEILCQEFTDLIEKFQKKMQKLFIQKKVAALFVPNDAAFFERLSISIFRAIMKPSFIFLHGLPTRYNDIDDNRADYLIVWGEKIKESYVKAGVEKNKILISGHPYFKEYRDHPLKFDLSNILIITQSMPWTPLNSNEVILSDRGNSILYLFSIERVLRELGVTSVKFRPHPVENSGWYFKFLNKTFYRLDDRALLKALSEATMVIGPSSTVFLESIYYGVNYVVYDPTINNKDLRNYPLVPPFDGSDNRIPVANSENDLKYIISNKVAVDRSFFPEYAKIPFDINFIKEII